MQEAKDLVFKLYIVPALSSIASRKKHSGSTIRSHRCNTVCQVRKCRRNSEYSSDVLVPLLFFVRFIRPLNTEATCSTELSVDFHRTTYDYVLEDRTLYSLRSGNFKSYVVELLLMLFLYAMQRNKIKPHHTPILRLMFDEQ